MYVSGLTIDMGEKGKEALEYLFRARATNRGLIARVPGIVLF